MSKLQELEKHLAQLPPAHPERRAAVVPAMQALQTERGYLDDAAVEEVARLTGLSATEVEELATFYSLIYRRPVGRHVLLVCDSLCCAMNGGKQLLTRVEQMSGVSLGEVTADGALSVLPSICLGLCDRAPAALVDGEALGPLDEFALAALLQRLQGED
ncbi:MAG: NADH-quinone oxidoreductase subunit NuoE [Gammaproteobacteria bacterium]|nr:NADH-quinone oxidoreductase subunit NuoE [Gammaproteobacteria bacterium]